MTDPTDPRPAPTRRAVIRTGMGLLGAATTAALATRSATAQPAAPPAPAPGQKLAQSAVMYQNHPNNGQLCSICVNFQAPNACTIVDGKINPIGWCVAFAPKAA